MFALTGQKYLYLSFFLSIFFLPVISAVTDWISTILQYFDTWCGLSANLECMSEICCTRLSGNTGRKNDSKIRHLRIIARLCQAISSQLRHISTVGKNVLSSNVSSRCLHSMVNFGLLTAEMTRFGSLGATQQISTAFASWLRYCSERRCSPEAHQTLHDVWPSPACYTMYTFSGALAPWRNFARCKIDFVCTSCVLLYCQCYYTALEQPASAACY